MLGRENKSYLGKNFLKRTPDLRVEFQALLSQVQLDGIGAVSRPENGTCQMPVKQFFPFPGYFRALKYPVTSQNKRRISRPFKRYIARRNPLGNGASIGAGKYPEKVEISFKSLRLFQFLSN